MLEALQSMTQGQQDQFKDTANKLLTTTFLSRDKKDNQQSYYFLMSYKDVFSEFFKILGYEIELDVQAGAVMLYGANAAATLKLKRDESVILLILRLLYHENQKNTSLNENIVCSVSDIHNKYDLLEIKKKLNKTDLVASLRLLRKYNLIEIAGDPTSSACKLVILPTILMAVKSEDITEVYNTINRITQEDND